MCLSRLQYTRTTSIRLIEIMSSQLLWLKISTSCYYHQVICQLFRLVILVTSYNNNACQQKSWSQVLWFRSISRQTGRRGSAQSWTQKTSIPALQPWYWTRSQEPCDQSSRMGVRSEAGVVAQPPEHPRCRSWSHHQHPWLQIRVFLSSSLQPLRPGKKLITVSPPSWPTYRATIMCRSPQPFTHLFCRVKYLVSCPGEILYCKEYLWTGGNQVTFSRREIVSPYCPVILWPIMTVRSSCPTILTVPGLSWDPHSNRCMDCLCVCVPFKYSF